MADIVEQVKSKKEEILQLKQDKAKQDGQKQQILEQLKESFDVDSLEAGEKKLEELDEALEKNTKSLEELDNQMGEIISAATSSGKEED